MIAGAWSPAHVGLKVDEYAESTGSNKNGRGAGIRTRDLFVPNEARYQAAPLPADHCNHAIIDTRADPMRAPGAGKLIQYE